MKRTLSTHLQNLRTNAKLTVKDLAAKANVPSTLISGLQSGQRSVGENNASRIGTALGLDGEALQNFIYAALNEATDKVLKENNGYPAELLNLLAGQLRQDGIEAAAILQCTVSGDQHQQNVILTLCGGRTATLKTQLLCA
jgi:transcriptional regulator with XRE-family HTH domain